MSKKIIFVLLLVCVVVFGANAKQSYFGVQGAYNVITEDTSYDKQITAAYLGFGLRTFNLTEDTFGMYYGGHVSVYNYVDIDGQTETFLIPAINTNFFVGIGFSPQLTEQIRFLIAAGAQANMFQDFFEAVMEEDPEGRSILNATIGPAVDMNVSFAFFDSVAIGIGAELGYDLLPLIGSFIDAEGYSQYRLHPYIFLRQ